MTNQQHHYIIPAESGLNYLEVLASYSLLYFCQALPFPCVSFVRMKSTSFTRSGLILLGRNHSMEVWLPIC